MVLAYYELKHPDLFIFVLSVAGVCFQPSFFYPVIVRWRWCSGLFFLVYGSRLDRNTFREVPKELFYTKQVYQSERALYAL